ncbi:Methylmalonyl-CoA carboxyltransferase 12S subunit [Crateriforma conspicua]|uniref:Methylmalonyl-CoA carboxyltransferase 12S subunit n=2 Tax=Crateriforma conspicua TaxID=2527996 RepID=A0A5C5Y671_9PLAN|nr:acyl-CoA carboxylase subunit beta [Crateriforma conspicua]QDV65239.1 Methylmalonyl-CoA carboxyltransferase 12S subunit [Crateriforma conspicua]TWT70634.1 Methylmalonyl-CoA carboxyltransferase 12S subunit [Crateriforma conspicua]
MTAKDKNTMDDLVDDLRQRRDTVMLGGGEKRLEKQRDQGKMTARERVDNLVDDASFEEFGIFAEHRQTQFGLGGRVIPADGVVTGAASIDGRLVHLASQDFTVLGGSAGEVHSLKVADAMKRSLKTGSPFVFLNDSGGARVQEGIDSLSGYGQVFRSNVLLSGAVPQISLICGPCAGGAAYSPALTDFVIQTRKAQMFITGPQVIKQVTGEEITAEQLGGADSHMIHSGVVHFVARDDADALHICRRLLSFLPSNNLEDAPIVPCDDNLEPNPELNNIVPVDHKAGYDIRAVIAEVVDRKDFLEVQAGHATNMVVGFARILGRTVGIVANQPMVLAGAIDNHAANKASRFIRFCNAFNIPLVTMVDVPGYLPGVEQEYNGIIRNGAKLLFAYSAATVPMVQLILRKSYGGAHVAMCSRDIGADAVFAWPTAEVAVMGAEGAVEIVFRKEMAEAEDPVARRAELIAEYREAFASPYVAAGRRLVDDVIEPADTRKHIARALEYLRNKRDQRPPKKHGLIPL